VVVDFSFWRAAQRLRYKQLVEECGGEWKLVYLEAAPEVLRQRLKQRSERFDANAAFPITPDVLSSLSFHLRTAQRGRRNHLHPGSSRVPRNPE
jgi:AAA domain